MNKVTLVFLRHAKVPSHKGDMPLTEDSNSDIEAAVPRLKSLAKSGDQFVFLATETHRSRQTAEALREAIEPGSPDVKPAFGLRNPDLYLAGSRVEMGSTAEFLGSQCEFFKMPPEAVKAHAFFASFLSAPDRIEYWLTHETPPGENAAAVAKRVLQFAQSFLAIDTRRDLVVVCVTHSPVMRAILTKGLGIADPGEPGWVEEILLEVAPSEMRYQFREHRGSI